MSSVLRTQSDSEDDSDYAPPVREELSSDSEGGSQQKRKPAKAPDPSTEEIENQQKDRGVLWANFQASVASSSGQRTEKAEEKRMVKIQKKYLFAGDYINEVVEVPEDSPDAKKWPLYQGAEEKADFKETTTVQSEAPSVPTTTSATISAPPPKPPIKKPGPRKPRTVLGAMPSSSSQKAKKLTTLDKSLMDWKAHTQDTKLQDELEANRKGGGYLEKVEFLQRVEERKEENLEAMKSRKRRKL